MKFVFGIIGVLLAGIAGYMLEPSMEPLMLAQKAEKVQVQEPEKIKNVGGLPLSVGIEPADEALKAPKVEQPEEPPVPSPALPDWVADLQPGQLPEKVRLINKTVISVEGLDEPVTLPANVEVGTIRVEGSELVISPLGGPFEGRVAILSTNLLELLGDKPPEAVVAMDDPGGPDSPVALSTDDEAETNEDVKLDPDEIVSLMQEAIKDGQIKEFGFDQVSEWKGGEETQHDGKTYQTGMLTFRTKTIFGTKDLQAQALIQDGEIVKWIWPNSGMELK